MSILLFVFGIGLAIAALISIGEYLMGIQDEKIRLTRMKRRIRNR